MNFHLNFKPEKSSFEIDHKQSIFLLGSCFSENIGKYLLDNKFKISANPNGILFNPWSLYNCIKDLIENKKANERFILERDGLFYSYFHHSSIHASSKKELVEKLDAITQKAHADLKSAKVLVITFGTAFFYRHKDLQQTVANCHKQPGSAFEKKLMEVDDIVTSYSELIKELKSFNPGLKIIFTVSPVKYLKDGVIENNLSKSTLLLSINKLKDSAPEIFYFPAFELLNDDLRDYRFYKEDLAHPNQQAVEYIWEKFSECYFNSNTQHLISEIQKLNSALNHRQIHSRALMNFGKNSPESDKHKTFIEKQKDLIKKLDSSIEF